MNLGSFHDEFCKYFLYEKSRTRRTVITYRYNFKEFLYYLEENSLPAGLAVLQDYMVLRKFMYSLLDRGLNRKTVRQRMLSLKSFCKYLVRENILERNPFDRFDIPKKEKCLPNPLQVKEKDRVLTFVKKRAEKTKALRDIQAVVMMELGLKSGLRKGAMRSVQWDMIDFVNKRVRVIDKGQKEKNYVLVPSTIYWLKLLSRVRGSDRGYLLLSPKSGTPISETSLHDEFKRYIKLAGLDAEKINLHRLRHSYGTYLLDRGLNLREVQEALNHDDINSTTGYLEVSNKSLSKKIRRAFSGGK